MSDTILTDNYLRANTEQSKKISIVVAIEDLPTFLSNRTVYTVVRYGDPGIFYGQAGLVYGSLRRVDDTEAGGVKDILSLDGSSLTLQQRLEPEQGRGAVSTLTLAFIDKAGYMSQLISPGVILDDILGKTVQVFLGYEQLSFPQDYFQIFRGFVSAVDSKAGLVTMQLSDPNIRRRQRLFFSAMTELVSTINNSVTTIPLISTSNFYTGITGPTGVYDPAILPYIKVDDEFIQYSAASGVSGNYLVGVTRGARDTVPSSHDAGAAVSNTLQIQDHAIDMALKLMLSGWDGPWISDQTLKSIAQTTTTLGILGDSVVLPDNVDALKDYGLVIGDYLTVTGSMFGGNNGQFKIKDIIDGGSVLAPNQIIRLFVPASGFTPDYPTTATFSTRSQYDTYPILAGLKMTPLDVDVQGHLDLKDQFLSDNENRLRFLIDSQQTGKTFIESQIYLPLAVYSLTRRGRVSAKITKPPLGSANLLFLNQDNILEPQQIKVTRATNTRHFFNEILIQYDKADDGRYLSLFDRIDSDSLETIKFSSVLPITSDGVKSDLSGDIDNLLTKRAQFLLSRYGNAAVEITLKVNYEIGNRIEAGDVIALDGTDLFITNFMDGSRDFGVQLFEVINRSLDIRNGTISLMLISGVGGSASDRFGSIAPSTVLDSGSTSSQLVLKDSFSPDTPKFPGNEPKKWSNYVGWPILVHDENFTVSGQTVISSFDITNPYLMNVTPALGFTPPSGYVIDVPQYPDTENVNDNSIYKNVHTFLSPHVNVVSGAGPSQFAVAASGASYFFVGANIRVHDYYYNYDSGDAVVATVSGQQITTKTPLPFTPSGGMPSGGMFVDLIGFKDHGGSYRWI